MHEYNACVRISSRISCHIRFTWDRSRSWPCRNMVWRNNFSLWSRFSMHGLMPVLCSFSCSRSCGLLGCVNKMREKTDTSPCYCFLVGTVLSVRKYLLYVRTVISSSTNEKSTFALLSGSVLYWLLRYRICLSFLPNMPCERLCVHNPTFCRGWNAAQHPLNHDPTNTSWRHEVTLVLHHEHFMAFVNPH